MQDSNKHDDQELAKILKFNLYSVNSFFKSKCEQFESVRHFFSTLPGKKGAKILTESQVYPLLTCINEFEPRHVISNYVAF